MSASVDATQAKAQAQRQGQEQEREQVQVNLEENLQAPAQAPAQTQTRPLVSAKPDSPPRRELPTKYPEKCATKAKTRNRKLPYPPFNLVIPTFDSKEIVLGKLLGRGSFSDVVEIRNFTIHEEVTSSRELTKLATTNQSNNNEDAKQIPSLLHDKLRKLIADHYIREQSDNASYALKCLRKSNSKTNKNDLHSRVMNMAFEASVLSRLQHPNIIKLHAMSNYLNTSETNISTMNISNYFLILDRINDTLRNRILQWKEKERQMGTLVNQITTLFPSRSHCQEKKLAFLDQRLAAAFDLSAAVKYIHEKKIVHRDIKPENIGFDVCGGIKLFDFGVARQLHDKDVSHYHQSRTGTELYHLTRMTGSLRYMAPEVFLGKPYNEKCDAYSLSIVIWEMIALEQAYSRDMIMASPKASIRAIAYNANESLHTREGIRNKDKDDNSSNGYEQRFIDNIIINGFRPPIREKWPMTLKDIFIYGWHSDFIHQRHGAANIQDLLFAEISKIHKDDSGGLHNQERHRSKFVMKFSKKIKRWSSTNSSVAADGINDPSSSHSHYFASSKSAISGGSNSRAKLTTVVSS